MSVGIAQSQSLIASVSVSTSLTAKVTKGPASATTALADAARSSGDVIDLGQQVDAGYVQKVLQDSLVDRLNAALKSAGLDMTADELMASKMDMSPEATSKRIVDFATGFYQAYQNNHKLADGLSGEEVLKQSKERLDGFVSLIRSAIDEGFGGAQKILSGIGPIPSEVQSRIDKTYDLTMKGLDDFAARERKALEDAAASTSEKASVI